MLAPGACSDTDDLGYCTSRWHDPGCSAVAAASAATGDAHAARAWRDTLARRALDPYAAGAAQALGLATPAWPGSGVDVWADLLEPPGGPDPQLHARMMAILGGEGGSPSPEPAWPRLDVSEIRRALGI